MPVPLNPEPSNATTQYVETTEYDKLVSKIKDLVSVMDDLNGRNTASRKLRYAEIDIESERAASKLQPDELYIPQHIIDANIRREQASYVQYITQSPRAVVLQDLDIASNDTSMLERDVTGRMRYDGWQIPMFSNIDGMQQNGYGIMEVVLGVDKPGGFAREFVQFGDFGMVTDTKNLQDAEMVARQYYMSKTKLLDMAKPDSPWQFDTAQVDRIIDKEPKGSTDGTGTGKEKSLFKVQKVMFRVGGVVQVGWSCTDSCDAWLRAPRPLFIGRKAPNQDPIALMQAQLTQVPPKPIDVFETDYPYFLFPYLISENDVITQLKGRVFLDQDTQEAATSIISSFCTAHRRGAGMYFSKDTDDPNADIATEKNIYFKPGILIPQKIKQFQLAVPGADTLAAVQAIVTANQQETSQVNFAAQNRKDSRKTATEISAATQTQQSLSTVQVVLFSNSLREMHSTEFEIVRSRVLTGIIQSQVAQLYQRNYTVKPAGDIDVIERQQLINQMLQMWTVMANTPAAPAFLADMLSKMFPESAPKYIQIMQQAMQQQQSAQAQQQQQMMGGVAQMAKGIVTLSEHPEFFSDTGKVHALPVVQESAKQIKQLEQGMKQNG